MKFLKSRTCSHSPNYFEEKRSIKILNRTQEKIKKIKLQMNEHINNSLKHSGVILK